MHLKSIRAFGFKSFADKIDLEIKDGITAIVGPNGSGKSNIVDAVRWVLGEQSVKSLRGSDTMSDVIFSGSKTRPAHNRAYVSLVFDNSDHYLNSEFKEVEIKRVIYNTGENEYYINNSKVRLKDVTDLFLDTGAGNDSFNIISQGSVSDIINSKPEARRVIFEDAAGVLKYKKRKEVSLKKLEKTKENLFRVKLVIDELEKSVMPLKKQSEVAKKYLSLKDELKSIEIALIASDITNINIDYKKIKTEIETLQKELSKITSNNTEDNTKLEKLKLKHLKLEEAITVKNNEYVGLTENLASLEAEKLVTMERKKYDTNKDKIEEALIKLKEEQLNIKKEIATEKAKLDDIISDIKEKSIEKDKLDNMVITEKVKRTNLITKINDYSKEILVLENKIEILDDNIKNNSKMPNGVRSVLNNMRLTGVHNTIGNLIENENMYSVAIETVLGSSSNFLVVDDEAATKECIDFLKINKLGRATFFPLNIIKAKSMNELDINKIKFHKGFINIASSLVTYDKEYDNIIKNQLGNVIVVDNIDSLNEIGKILDYKYRIVSLDGEILYSGGSIAGGSSKNNSVLNDKLLLNEMQEKLEITKLELERINKEYRDFNNNFNILELKETELSKQLINLNEILNTRTNKIRSLEEALNKKELEIKGNEDMGNNTLDEKLLNILEEASLVASEKDIALEELNKLKKIKSDLALEINEVESKYHKTNTEYNRIQNDLKDKEVKLGKYDVKLDNLLLELSENYSLTYECACSNYELELPEELARTKVDLIKKDIFKLGEVNIGAINEYERVSERYNFLIKQSEDLEESSSELTNIINEMDKIMIERFKETFANISKEFNQVFRKLFKGGYGALKLTNPNDILNTGIDIEAEPPGKKLNSIALLSGGEKTLTAIAVLFAILNVKPSPFCVLDEVEAALDEANVDTFGKYLQEKKEVSQFILITHKKRTMEYADVLYGITMQESGVSKIVSVNLENM
ncbi:MAG: chromosome segregation protein SMC [Firmicutes bacterium]|nr:chromosome segregation protein SMC [Bacillota bacterium]